MKSSLSAIKYIKNNKRTCGVLLLALSLTFMAMYVVNYLLMTTEESFKTIMLELPNKVSYADLAGSTLGVRADGFENKEDYYDAADQAREEVMEKIAAIPGVKNVEYTQIISARYDGIIGQIYYECPLIEKEELPKYMEHFGAKLVEGRMPENPGEILVDSVVMKNQGYEIGGNYLEESFGETFKVAGVIESDYMICMGLPNGFTNKGWYMVMLGDESIKDVRKLMGEIGITPGEKDDIIDSLAYKKFYDTDVIKTIDSVVNTIILIIIIFLAVSIIVAYVSFMRNRLNEYCLYASLGYSKKEVYGMIMREMLIIFMLGIIAGFLLSLMLMGILDAGAIEPKGLISRWFYPGHIAKICAALVCIIGVLQIPILISINSIKTIDMMED